MKTVELTAGGAQLDELYRNVLLPSFPSDELTSLESLRDGVRDGSTRAVAVVDDDGRVVAGSVGEWSPSCRVMLLAYFAVTGPFRGTGIGGSLYTEAIGGWRKEYAPCLILAEVEHPGHHAGTTAHGDPGARLRFYGRLGARVLALPYFQPALGPGRSRVYGMLLLALHVDAELAGPGGPDTVAAEPLRAFLTEYWELAEGGVGKDPATTALWQALAAEQGVPALPADRFAEVPVTLA